MDVSNSIVIGLDEAKDKTEDFTLKELFKKGLGVGRNTIGTMANTLILVYFGSALELILLYMACDMTLVEILNKEAIAESIISAIAGSMGVIYTIPITAFAYGILNKHKTIYKTESQNKVEGKRSLKI